MGLFLSASGVVSPNGDAVREALSSYVASTGGTFELRDGTPNDRNIGVLQSSTSTTTVLYPDGFSDWDDLSRFISVELNTPVFSFHIHDGDLWMFVAFDNGEEVAWFNPIPDYWENVDDAERSRWSGDAESVASLVPGVQAFIGRQFRAKLTFRIIPHSRLCLIEQKLIGCLPRRAHTMARDHCNHGIAVAHTPTSGQLPPMPSPPRQPRFTGSRAAVLPCGGKDWRPLPVC